MDKYSTLGELLYIISNYEKGRIKINKIWTMHYVNSLADSILIMDDIIKLLKQSSPIMMEDMQSIFYFINKNLGRIFPKSFILKSFIECRYSDLFLNNYINPPLKESLDLMYQILLECRNILINKPKNYKKKIMYLLMAFHNMPRVYLNTKNDTFFNIKVFPVTQEEAFKYANHYVYLSNNL